MKPHGLIQIAAASIEVAVGAPAKNAIRILEALDALAKADAVVFPELCLTGYTAADLFGQQTLLHAADDALSTILNTTERTNQLVVVGMPIAAAGSLYNCAAVLSGGRILGIVPKQFLPNYKEFYEPRWFRAADGSEPESVRILGDEVPFGIDLLFRSGDVIIGVEICEDLWTPIPPSSHQALAGANVLLNLSASTAAIGKARWRSDLIRSQSGRCVAGYAYAGAGPSESTTDVVFEGHCLIAENGVVLNESRRIGDGGLPWEGLTYAMADVDVQKLEHDRRATGPFAGGRALSEFEFRVIDFLLPPVKTASPLHPPSGRPFIPAENSELDGRCAEIFAIQTAGLAKRVQCLHPDSSLVIGVSGGLDSTLALLSAVKACDAYGWPRQRILGVTMPGFGTTELTRRNADLLMEKLGIRSEAIDIRPLALTAFQSLDHEPLGVDVTDIDAAELQQRLQSVPADEHDDLVFENVQARLRTFLLMSRGFVLGTGDLSEQALGWSTYNGDHMSMYNVNTSVPKTLVRFLVRYAADHHFEGTAREVLHAIADTTISPELLPPDPEGKIRQSTEEKLGDYELHDFFLYQVIRFGSSPEKIRYLARHAKFSRDYHEEEIERTLQTFIRRFFANQFKRSCVPDGPKVGSVSLSPRGDWRMPSDADPDAWLG